MTEAQIWVFGFLVFLLLLALIGGRTRRNATGSRQQGERLEQQLAEIRTETADVKARLTAIEQTLRQSSGG